jgi:hypothetical protein
MKSIGFSIIGLVILGSQALASEPETIIQCQATDPAFTMVHVNRATSSNGLSQLSIVVSRSIDAEKGTRGEDIYKIVTVEKDRLPLKDEAYSSALFKVIEDTENDRFDGTIVVKAIPLKSKSDLPLFLNFQRFDGDLPNSMVIGGLALRLKCTIGC